MLNKKNVNIHYKKMTKNNAKEVLLLLKSNYKELKCGLNYNTPYELLVALILAAQCTDKRVNEILPIFMNKFKTIKKVATSDLEEIIEVIKPCGYYNSKAKSIKESSIILLKKYNCLVPDTMDELLSLKGIGRKSANIILQECFNKIEGIAVDTHVTRLARKIGISNGSTQEKIEKDLMNTFDKNYYGIINHILVTHGRNICIAKHPKCEICIINNLCKKND